MLLTRNLVFAVIAFGTLYIPQPMLPLAVAPVLYGYFLQAIPARLMLQVALSLLALNQVCFVFADEFRQLLGLRLMQGLLLPAIFTALMAYCASVVAPQTVRRAMGS